MILAIPRGFAGRVEIIQGMGGDGVTKIVQTATKVKPKIRKVGSVWICYTDWYHVPCTGRCPEEAYTRWKTHNDRPKFYL